MKHYFQHLVCASAFLACASAAFAATPELNLIFDAPLKDVVSNDYSDATVDPAYYYTAKREFSTGWYYQNVSADDGLSKEGVGTYVSLSRLSDKANPDAWLLLPKFVAESSDWLVWKAKSIHDSFKNSYDVMIAVDGDAKSDFKILCHVDKEDYFFNTHAISLAEYAGKNVTIAFVNNDPSGYMLALREVHAGKADSGILAERIGHIFFGKADEKSLDFRLSNFGTQAQLISLKVVEKANPENELGSKTIESLPAIGESVDVSIDFDAEVGTALQYDLVAMFDDGSSRTLLSDWLNVSHFRRRALLEKASGTWCNNCPKVTYATHVMRHRLGIDGIFAETHVSNRIDENHCDSYLSTVSYSPFIGGDYPAVSINRAKKLSTTKPFEYESTVFQVAMTESCIADITADVKKYDGQSLSVEATVTVAEDIDNSSDFYRVLFLVGEKNVALSESDSQQKSQGFIDHYYGEVSFLPTRFPRDITVYENLSRFCSENGGAGIPASLPSELKADTPYTVKWDCTIPEIVTDPDNLQLIAVFLKYEKNAGSTPTPAFNSFATDIEKTEESGVDFSTINVSDSDPVYYNLQGLKVENPASGIYIKIQNGKAVKVLIP